MWQDCYWYMAWKGHCYSNKCADLRIGCRYTDYAEWISNDRKVTCMSKPKYEYVPHLKSIGLIVLIMF